MIKQRAAGSFAANHLLGCLCVGVLHQGLEPRLLLKRGNLLHCAERREHQVQRVQRDIHAWLCTGDNRTTSQSQCLFGMCMVPALRTNVSSGWCAS
jgi:hypothetical protein